MTRRYGQASDLKRGLLDVYNRLTSEERRITHAKKSFTRLALIVMLFAGGCANQAEFLNNNQDNAMQIALSRAQFEMNCRQVIPVIISGEVVQPPLQGPWVNGSQRAEYTIGVSGCGRRTTFVVICPQYGDGCFAAGPGRFHDWQ
jgi:hypothetical protein